MRGGYNTSYVESSFIYSFLSKLRLHIVSFFLPHKDLDSKTYTLYRNISIFAFMHHLVCIVVICRNLTPEALETMCILCGVFNTFVFVSDYGSIRSFYPAKSYFINIYIL